MANVSHHNGDVARRPEYILKPTTRRGVEWCEYALAVLQHVEKYACGQYLDAPNDQIEGYSIEQCAKNSSKYGNRFGKNERDGQELLDPLKTGHYACCWWSKQKEELSTQKTEESDLKSELTELVYQVAHDGDWSNVDDFMELFKKHSGNIR